MEGKTYLNGFKTATSAFTVLMFTVFPLAIRDYTDVTKVKYNLFVAFFVLLVLSLGALFFKAVFDGNKLKTVLRDIFAVRLTVIDVFVLSYVVLCVITSLFSPYGAETVLLGASRYEGLLLLLMYSATYFALTRFGAFRDLYWILICVSSLLMSAVTVIQLCGVNFLWLYPSESFTNGVTIFVSTIGNIDIMSGFYCIAIPVAFTAFIYRAEKAWQYALCGVSFAASLFCEIKIDVASGRVALAVTAAAMLPVLLKKIKRCKKLPVIAACIEGAAAIGGAVYLKWFYPLKKGFFGQTAAFLNGRLADGAGSYRGIIWKYSFDVFKSNPITGTGTGTFYKSFNAIAADAIRTRTDMGEVDFAHNEYLQVLCNNGVFAFAAFTGIAVSAVIKGYIAALKDEKICVLLAPLICYFTQAVFSFSIVIVTPLVWIMLALLNSELKKSE